MRPGPTPSHKRKYLVLILILAAIGVLAGIILNKTGNDSRILGSLQKTEDSQEPIRVEGLNGTLVEEEVAKQRPIAVIVENHTESRPQAGLSQADIVYETIAEGGITRFLALFQTQQPNNIGPIRSVRTYFAEFANEWGAVLAHVGGQEQALANIKNGVYKNINDADQFYNGDYFHRISSRPAPHNVYTSLEKLHQLSKDKKFKQDRSYAAWKFKDDNKLTNPLTKTITIPFSTPSYSVTYHYNADANTYMRTVAGGTVIDSNTKLQIAPKNVVVQFAASAPIPGDTKGSITFTLTGSGKAKVFLDGNVIDGTWKKTSGVTKYFDAAGNEISFNRGQTWVELVPSSLASTVIAK